MHTAKANSITIEPPPLIGGAEPVYYFHGNHLGSANWVTLQNASPTQFLLHLPYGEEFVKQLSGSYDERFTFTGKEKDAETGYYYFGARFDNVDLGFMSVDPMADKYPSISPFAYCAWNPVKLVDPNGRDWYENELTGEVFYNSHMGKNDAGTGSMTGEGWKWMGKNDMFGKVDARFINDNSEFLNSNGAQLSGYTMQTLNDGFVGVDEMRFGGNSEAFMSKMGYKKYPLVQDVQIKETTIIMPDAQGPRAFTFTDKNETVERTYSYTYAPKNSNISYQAIKYKNKKYKLHPFTNRMVISTFERRKYEYHKSPLNNSSPSIFDFIIPVVETISKML